MNRPLALFLSPLVATVLLLGTPAPAVAASTFYGIVIHVSDNSIKVQDPRSNQTLAFEIVPHFDQLFSADGKTTYQMKDIHAGRYVGIVYDQKFLGMRHADKIYLLNNRNQRVGQP
ncbi:MAG TPA: hypothetical protein VK702_00010 [Candidatus Acidoferrum sp.]|nr:hypothetical protein [Candidatus Acidoferrum sp.]